MTTNLPDANITILWHWYPREVLPQTPIQASKPINWDHFKIRSIIHIGRNLIAETLRWSSVNLWQTCYNCLKGFCDLQNHRRASIDRWTGDITRPRLAETPWGVFCPPLVGGGGRTSPGDNDKWRKNIEKAFLRTLSTAVALLRERSIKDK